MKKPVIGVTPLYDDDKESIWMLPGYLELLSACGALPVILPLYSETADATQMLSFCDGFLFTGGHDVNPSLYKEKPLPICGSLHQGRDELEQKLFSQAFQADRPVFGICRGLQFINVMLGGSLYQDLAAQKIGAISHRMQPPYDAPWHEVTFPDQTPLGALLHKSCLGVNSCHHQGIRLLAPVLLPMAVSADGLVEAFYHPGRLFLQAVQWHPEFAWRTDDSQRLILESFVTSCRL